METQKRKEYLRDKARIRRAKNKKTPEEISRINSENAKKRWRNRTKTE